MNQPAMRRSGRMLLTTSAFALLVPLVLGACSQRPAARPEPSHPAKAVTALPELAVRPAANAKRVPITSAISTAVTGGYVQSVTLTDASGRLVAGTLRGGRDAWVPASSLAYGAKYTARVIASNGSGGTRTVTTSFTTMAKPSGKPISATVNVKSGQTYGVGMPIVLDFSASIPVKDRAAVEGRLTVTSMPAQVGAWSWQSPTQVVYRTQNYWRAGTSVTFKAALNGLPVGDRVVGADRSAAFVIGPDIEYSVSDPKHTLTVTSNGQVLHTYPVSMGKPSTKSWSGRFVIMERDYYTVFDTLGQPGGYRVGVNFAERLSWSGMFFHAAPWSVYAQGHYDVSHGCINLGPSNAKWIYENSHIGDPVTITGTGRPVVNGNGWTAWNVSWDAWVKGSALGSAPVASASGAVPGI
jgi:lipoprotein-anchoring transpeptidase ErfK/SrfK